VLTHLRFLGDNIGELTLSKTQVPRDSEAWAFWFVSFLAWVPLETDKVSSALGKSGKLEGFDSGAGTHRSPKTEIGRCVSGYYQRQERPGEFAPHQREQGHTNDELAEHFQGDRPDRVKGLETTESVNF